MYEPLCIGRLIDAQAWVDAMTASRQRHGKGAFVDLAESGFGKGQLRTFVEQDIAINIVDMVLERSIRSQCEAIDDVLLVRANIGTACTYTSDDDVAWRFVRPEVSVSFLPAGTKIDVLIEPDMMHMAVTMLLRPSALVNHYGLSREDLPGPLVQAIDGKLTQPMRLLTLPLDPGMASLIEDLLRSRLPESLKVLQASARSAELLLLITAAWNEQLAAGNAANLRGRDAYLIAAARRILTERLVDPPTLQELAQELGTNRNKLNQLFQRGLGVTPKAFCVQRRIERAQALLREGRLNVAQIAETVGYQHQSSFAAAFREVVGMCPRDYGNARHGRSPEPLLAA